MRARDKTSILTSIHSNIYSVDFLSNVVLSTPSDKKLKVELNKNLHVNHLGSENFGRAGELITN